LEGSREGGCRCCGCGCCGGRGRGCTGLGRTRAAASRTRRSRASRGRGSRWLSTLLTRRWRDAGVSHRLRRRDERRLRGDWWWWREVAIEHPLDGCLGIPTRGEQPSARRVGCETHAQHRYGSREARDEAVHTNQSINQSINPDER